MENTNSLTQQLLSYWINLSRRNKLIILLTTGFSLTVLAIGVVLRQRRRKYRAIQPQFGRQDTFYSLHRRVSSFPSPIPEVLIESDEDSSVNSREGTSRRRLSTEYILEFENLSIPYSSSDVFLSLSQTHSQGPLSDDFFDATDLSNPYNFPQTMTTPTTDYLSDSEESFESAPESFSNNSSCQLYITSLQAVNEGLVHCRTLRTDVLGCSSDKDFLAKLCCVRQALDKLLLLPANKDYIIEAGKNIMTTLLVQSQQDPHLFVERYMDIIQYCQQSSNWDQAETELRERGVVSMNIFDIALDFMLLDAFDDLGSPPSALVSVIQNGWISDGIKQSMLNTAVWSILKTKKSLLKNKNGFMAKFYLLSETLSPVFAWGFLGNNDELHQRCQRFKIVIMKFLHSIFSLDTVRYSTINTLSDDIMNHTRRVVCSLSDV